MFILRGLKKLFFLALFVGLVWWAAHYKIQGKPLYKVAGGFIQSGNFKEGWKDIKLFVGGFLKTVGEQIQEDVTEEDRKKLDSMIKEKAKQGAQNEPYKKLQN